MTRFERSKTRWPRRRFLKSAAGAGALAALSPAWVRGMQVLGGNAAGEGPQVFDLAIREQTIGIAGGRGKVVTINDTVPGPLLEWYEGRDVIVKVTNHMQEDTSIHWHGILLPFDMDGVPGVSFRGIAPGTTFEYRFPVKQSGTYWYHSHSGLQEQSGMYGPLIVHPKESDPAAYDRDYVVMLSDWTFENPYDVMAKLKKLSDYYNRRQFTLTDLYGVGDEMSAREQLQNKLAWDRMRMMPTDIADVTGETYSYLLNGRHPAGNWTGLFEPGERVRLRFINGSSMSYFNVRIPGLPMNVVAADGQNVQPVETDEFQIGVAETYDVVVEPRTDSPYTIMAESIDRSGYAAGTLATRPGQRAPIPPLRKRPLLTMADMGMDHDHAGGGAPAAPAEDAAGNGSGGDHAAHGSGMQGGMDHGGHGMDHGAGDEGGGHGQETGGHQPAHGSAGVGPAVARHDADRHGFGNAGVATVQRDRLGEPGTGLHDVPHRALVYKDLRRLDDDFDERPPARELELHLTGHMERYMWSFDGVQFHEVDGPIEFADGERLRLTLVNDTMMNHPIHLHGMWMELENGQGRRIPRKHTINIMPAARVSALISADAPGRWAFHCHLLYHMEMGMFRVVRVA